MRRVIDDLVGREFAGFRLTHRLGEGGMATVFRAENMLDPGIVRAIKVIFPELSSQPEFVKRFTLEARVLDQLQHPNIVRFFGLRWVRDGEVPLLAMELELFDGMSLDALLAALGGDRLPFETVLVWMKQASEGVAAAHAMGVVHRDLKPENLFVTRTKQIKVLDFGIAKAVDDAKRTRHLTTPGMLPGTAAYMAPEICRGDVPTPAADVYALGMVMFELLTGRHPFAEPGRPSLSGMQMMMAQIERAVPPARSIRADVPHEIDEIVQAATAKDPSHRFKDAAALAAVLRGQQALVVNAHQQASSLRTTNSQPAPNLTDFALAPIVGTSGDQQPSSPSAPNSQPHANLTNFALGSIGGSYASGSNIVSPSAKTSMLPAIKSQSSAGTVSIQSVKSQTEFLPTPTASSQYSHVPNSPIATDKGAKFDRNVQRWAIGLGVCALGVLAVAAIVTASSQSNPPTPNQLTAAPTAQSQPNVSVLQPVSSRASSFFVGPTGNALSPNLAFDGDVNTAWNENTPGPGTGEWIEADYGAIVHFRHLRISTGWDGANRRDGYLFYKNSHLRRVQITFDGANHQIFDVASDQRTLDVNVDVTGRVMRVLALDVYPGTRWADLCISEITVEGAATALFDRARTERFDYETSRIALAGTTEFLRW